MPSIRPVRIGRSSGAAKGLHNNMNYRSCFSQQSAKMRNTFFLMIHLLSGCLQSDGVVVRRRREKSAQASRWNASMRRGERRRGTAECLCYVCAIFLGTKSGRAPSIGTSKAASLRAETLSPTNQPRTETPFSWPVLTYPFKSRCVCIEVAASLRADLSQKPTPARRHRIRLRSYQKRINSVIRPGRCLPNEQIGVTSASYEWGEV